MTTLLLEADSMNNKNEKSNALNKSPIDATFPFAYQDSPNAASSSQTPASSFRHMKARIEHSPSILPNPNESIEKERSPKGTSDGTHKTSSRNTGKGSPRSSISNSDNNDSAGLPSKHLQSLLSKHIKGDIDRAMTNFGNMARYHTQYIDSIDHILDHFIPSMLMQLRKYGERELTFEAENEMLECVRSDLDRFIPIPSDDQEINEIESLYSNFQIGWHHHYPHQFPEFYYYAIYLPTGIVPENKKIHKIYEDIRAMLVPLSTHLWRLQYGLHLRVPTVDDAHNTGLSVLRTVRDWIDGVDSTVGSLLFENGAFYYISNRLFYLSSIFYYRQSMDIRCEYLRWERDNFRYIRDMLRDLSLILLMLHHHIKLHIDLVKNPRVDHAGHLAAKITN